ncbi:MAG: UTP--glucose-1-phosphate uridylyltransferase [Parachlamydiaceae bacterium]
MEDLNFTIQILESIVQVLKTVKTREEKLRFLRKHASPNANLPDYLLDSIEKQVIYKSLQIIHQDKHLFLDFRETDEEIRKLEFLFEDLSWVETFYFPIGGIVGYHLTFLKLLSQKNKQAEAHIHYETPIGIHLEENSPETSKAIRAGIETLDQIGEIYPVAGAGDRLNLKDETTGEPLPAALLNFLGYSLLEGLIRDLQAREFLFYKLAGRQANTPVLLMTSLDKHNDSHIKAILEKNGWFFRSPGLFYFILQPLVPVITIEGLWATSDTLKIQMKPGGHGIIWKLAEDSGALDWFLDHQRPYALVRQINNPIAGVDSGLLALSGVGCAENKAFGFATCPRKIGVAEGVDVLIEKESSEGFEYCITNIEYTEFKRYGIHDEPLGMNTPFSKYPSNTNILFVSINTIKDVLKNHPFPGLLVNLKLQTECLNEQHQLHKVEVGRVESTMQNIADYIITKTTNQLSEEEKKRIRTFVTYNRREKTISVTKKLASQQNFEETPEKAFFDLQTNARDLFVNHCHFTLPTIEKETAFIHTPPFIISYHPALGPLYSIINQKIYNGRLSFGSELELEITELYLWQLHLTGSLIIKATHPLGHHEEDKLVYSERMGKCYLKNIEVRNKGIDYSAQNKFWKKEIYREEALEIILEEDAEFYAEDIIFHGSHQIFVPKKHRMIAKMEEGNIIYELKPISSPSWYWHYQFGKTDNISLTLKT